MCIKTWNAGEISFINFIGLFIFHSIKLYLKLIANYKIFIQCYLIIDQWIIFSNINFENLSFCFFFCFILSRQLINISRNLVGDMLKDLPNRETFRLFFYLSGNRNGFNYLNDLRRIRQNYEHNRNLILNENYNLNRVYLN